MTPRSAHKEHMTDFSKTWGNIPAETEHAPELTPRGALEQERDALDARAAEMLETLVGCEWCCGGGDQEMGRINERIAEIEALLKEGT